MRLLGPLPREECSTSSRRSTRRVLSSSWENFPHSVVESLAVGTPVIATQVGGVAEVVEDGENGLLVPAGDAAALAAAIARFFTDDDLAEPLRAPTPAFGLRVQCRPCTRRLVEMLEEAVR